MDDVTIVRVVADELTREYLRGHGGKVFVWMDSTGLKRVSTSEPQGITFERIDAGGFELFQDVSIARPTSEWRVVLRKFPHRHIDAVWDGWSPGTSGPASPGI